MRDNFAVDLGAVKLFGNGLKARPISPFPALTDDYKPRENSIRHDYTPMVDEILLEVFGRVSDPGDPVAICDLFLSYVEATTSSGDKLVANGWHRSKRQRDVSVEEILSNPATVAFVKELFNHFFRDDLYGSRRNEKTIILSSGAVCEQTFGLTSVGKAAVLYALEKDWYGYSDSNGLSSARSAIAAYENRRISDGHYSEHNVAITMGATHAINSLADMILSSVGTGGQPSLVAIPNYPPLVRSITKHGQVRLVPLTAENGVFSVDAITEKLTPITPLVFLQTVANPTGARICESSLQRLIEAAGPNTIILLDECHEFLGDEYTRCALRMKPNVVRVASLSKTWSIPGMKVGWIIADVEIIRTYYEKASTGYGGPPSLFYTLIEVIARFDRWRLESLTSPGKAERTEFGSQYDLTSKMLEHAYKVYLCDYENRAHSLSNCRGLMTDGLSTSSFDVMPPAYSINTLVFPKGYNESYSAYREIMSLVNVSTYPGILNFCFGSGGVRVTSALSWDELEGGIRRLKNLNMSIV